ncbi:MAG: transposase [Candidatus Pacebacteria bacterium]|nr:transposase [Candidatus Paceibacterota bacterium]
MGRRKISFINGEYYHIYNRGVDKRTIVLNKYDIFRILESFEVFNTTDSVGSIYQYSFKKKNNQLRSRGPKLVEIVAFNILDNHYHLVLKQLVDNGISKFMQNFSAGYTKHFNEKYDRSGTLFQGPFKAEHIDSDEYLNYVVAYVNCNHLVHGFEFSVSEWGNRSSLEQYVFDKKEWKNIFFECDTSMILHRYKNGNDYLKKSEEIAKNIKIKRDLVKNETKKEKKMKKENSPLETRFPSEVD